MSEKDIWDEAQEYFEEWRRVRRENPRPKDELENERRLFEYAMEFFEISGRTLDIGCGRTGSFIISMFDGIEYIGIDPWVVWSTNDFDGVCGFGEHLPFKDGVFDTVICMAALDHMMNADDVLAEIDRVVKPSGIINIAIWISPIECPGHPQFFTDDSLVDVVGGVFDIKKTDVWGGDTQYDKLIVAGKKA